MSPSAHFLVGPTAVGKSRVAQWIAEREGRAILAADTMTVYRGMDVGTAKPGADERARVRYYGLDLADPHATFSVAAWLAQARVAFSGPDGARLIVTGGTGLYVRCLTEGLRDSPPVDAEARAHWQRVFEQHGIAGLQEALRRQQPDALAALADPQNPRRVIRALELTAGGRALPARDWKAGPGAPLVGLRMAPQDLKTAIERRVCAMYDHGLVAEVERLLHEPAGLSETARAAIGYAEAIALIEGRMRAEDAVRRTVERTRQYAKRQRTWFERQAQVHWIDVAPDEPVEAIAGRVLAAWAELGPTEVAA